MLSSWLTPVHPTYIFQLLRQPKEDLRPLKSLRSCRSQRRPSHSRALERRIHVDEREESCCSIDYQHHKEIFEKRRRAYLENPEKAVTVHQARIRLIQDHFKEAQVPGDYTILCDEPTERGGSGKGPAPLQYFVASVGL